MPKGNQRSDTPDKDVVLVVGDMKTEISLARRETVSSAKAGAGSGSGKGDAASEMLTNSAMRLFAYNSHR